MSQFYQQFTDFILQQKLLENVTTIVAGISGGVDSMVLLDLLLKYREHHQIELIIVHLNHQLRGTDANRDEAFVKKYCKNHQCQFILKKANIRDYAARKKLSLEMAGREIRYALFEEAADKYPNSIIATAHTADDQLETILLHILKGTGLAGLQGIPIKRGNLIRPLLWAFKTDIYQYARENSIPYHEDCTNEDTSIPRNYLRHSLIPSIKAELNPAVERSIMQLSTIASDANQFLEMVGHNALKHCLIYRTSTEIALDIPRLKRYFISVKFEVIRESLRQLNPQAGSLDYSMMENILKLIDTGQTGNQLPLSNSLRVFIDRDSLIFVRGDRQFREIIRIAPGERYSTDLFEFKTVVLNKSDYHPEAENRNIEFVDIEKLGRNLLLRPWQESDKITPLGSSFSKKVSDIFIDQKIPLFKKSRIPILVSNQTIVWVCGCKLSEKFKIDAATQKVLKIIYREYQT